MPGQTLLELEGGVCTISVNKKGEEFLTAVIGYNSHYGAVRQSGVNAGPTGYALITSLLEAGWRDKGPTITLFGITKKPKPISAMSLSGDFHVGSFAGPGYEGCFACPTLVREPPH